MDPQVQQLQNKVDQFDRAFQKLQATRKQADQIATWLNGRYYWADGLAALRGAMIAAEQDAQKKLSAQHPGIEVGIWVEQLQLPDAAATDPNAPPQPNVVPLMNPQYMRGGPGMGMPGMGMPRTGMPGGAPPPPATPDQTAANATATNDLTLVCRAISVSEEEDGRIADAVETALKSSAFFDPKTTALTGSISQDPTTSTFTFHVNLSLANPLKL